MCVCVYARAKNTWDTALLGIFFPDELISNTSSHTILTLPPFEANLFLYLNHGKNKRKVEVSKSLFHVLLNSFSPWSLIKDVTILKLEVLPKCQAQESFGYHNAGGGRVPSRN